MPDENPTVYIVDDDPDFRESMSLMVRSMGLNAAAYPSAEAFLDGYSGPSNSPKCMVLDVRMSGLSGLGLQQMLAAQRQRYANHYDLRVRRHFYGSPGHARRCAGFPGEADQQPNAVGPHSGGHRP